MTKIISLIGIPGAGKSTQLSLLREKYGSDILIVSVPALLKNKEGLAEMLLTEADREQINNNREIIDDTRTNGRLSPFFVDKLLFDAVLSGKSDCDIVAMDGCPRGKEQAVYFWNGMTEEQKQNYCAIVLKFPENPGENSFLRQYNRTLNESGIEEAERRKQRFKNKIDVFCNDTAFGIDYIESVGGRVRYVDCTESREAVAEKINRIICGEPADISV